MENPFVYGEVVPAAAFVNRVGRARPARRRPGGRPEDLPDLAAPVRQVVARSGGRWRPWRRRGALTVEVTVSSFSSYVAFLEGYARALVAAETQLGSRADLAARRDPIGARRGPAMRRTPALVTARRADGVVPRRAHRARRVSRLAAGSVRAAGAARGRAQKKVVVALDEFQAIAGFNGGSVEHALRAAVQHQRDVGYVFAGSEPSLMEQMLTPKRPFYKAGPVMRLDKIPADEFAAFIDERFAALGHPARARPRRRHRRPRRQSALRRAAARARNLGRGARPTRRRATLDDLHQALRRLLSEQQTMFEALWQRLTLGQRAVLRAVVLEDGARLLSADVRTRHRLGGASSVQASLAALLRDDVIARDGDRYVVVDSLLREWIARKTY